MSWTEWWIIYLLVINLIGFSVMGVDKWKAIKGKWRIREKHLWTYFIIGGSVGGLIGMYFFHHKTKHRQFTVGIPVVIFLQIAGFVYFRIVS